MNNLLILLQVLLVEFAGVGVFTLLYYLLWMIATKKDEPKEKSVIQSLKEKHA